MDYIECAHRIIGLQVLTMRVVPCCSLHGVAWPGCDGSGKGGVKRERKTKKGVVKKRGSRRRPVKSGKDKEKAR